MPRKHIFAAQIENNMLESYADQREMVFLFSLLFFNELKLVGWIDFEGTIRLVLDSVDIADWKESHYKSGPVRLPEQTGFWN